MMSFNPSQIIQAIRFGQNPQQIMMQLLQSRMGQSPVGQNLISLAQNGDTKAIEQFARNLLANSGRDFDTEFSAFKKQMGLE